MLTGKTVVLRAFERADLKHLHRWQNDEELMRLARSWPDHAISAEAVEARYEKAIKGDEGEDRYYMIQEKGGQEPIGWATLTVARWTRRATDADLGIAIGEKDRWKKGYGTDVVSLLLREAFEQLNLHRVGWWTFAENEGSLALAKKMGFREEGRIRDAVFFDNRFHDGVVLGILRDEYEGTKKAPSTSKPRAPKARPPKADTPVKRPRGPRSSSPSRP
jgi:RimJ/RimL family protein N-acetyltransferase